MRKFKSALAPLIVEYLEFREILGVNGRQEENLYMFDSYCAEYHTDLKTLTRESVRGWVSYETSRGRGGMYNKISSVRMLAQYMGNDAYILPVNAVQPRGKSTPYILSDEELSRLFLAADNVKNTTCSSINLLFPTLLRLMYTCGLRPPEARLVKRDNIDFVTGEILIEKSKSHKERIVVMSDDMLTQCRKYDIIRNISGSQNVHYFVRSDGGTVSKSNLNYIFRRCWQEANPDIPANMLPRLRPYDLRHRFASTVLQKWLSEGRDLYAMLPYLSAYMGHESFSDTEYYIHLLPEHLLNSEGVDWSSIDDVNPEVSIWTT